MVFLFFCSNFLCELKQSHKNFVRDFTAAWSDGRNLCAFHPNSVRMGQQIKRENAIQWRCKQAHCARSVNKMEEFMTLFAVWAQLNPSCGWASLCLCAGLLATLFDLLNEKVAERFFFFRLWAVCTVTRHHAVLWLSLHSLHKCNYMAFC